MNAAGEVYILQTEEYQYCFSEMKITVNNRIEEMQLVDNRSYRVLASGFTETIYLKARIEMEQVNRYRYVLKYLAQDRHDLTLNGEKLFSQTLVFGRISVPEGSQFAVCEITITGVNE